MARYFWCAVSAYTRYVPEDIQKRLLDSISDSHGKKWHMDPTYQHIWHEQYAEVVNDYCTAVEHITERYLGSAAGKLFGEACAKQRKVSKSLPVFDIDCLRWFQGKPGIPWGIAEVEEFYAPLKEISETDALEFKVYIFMTL